MELYRFRDNIEKHFIIDIKESELKIIYGSIKGIGIQRRDYSGIEASIMRDIKDILEEDN